MSKSSKAVHIDLETYHVRGTWLHEAKIITLSHLSPQVHSTDLIKARTETPKPQNSTSGCYNIKHHLNI